MRGIYALTKVIEMTNGSRCPIEITSQLIEIDDKLKKDRDNNYETFRNTLEELFRKGSKGCAWESDHWIVFATFWQNGNDIENQKECLMKAFRKIQVSIFKLNIVYNIILN